MIESCIWCPGKFEPIEGETHEYIESTPGCWNQYNKVLRYQFNHYDKLLSENRLTVDTYAVQHPGKPSRKSKQSVLGHLIRLYLILEQNRSDEYGTQQLREFVKLNKKFPWFDPPNFSNTMHIGEIEITNSIENHKKSVNQWIVSVWKCWKRDYLSLIEDWIIQLT